MERVITNHLLLWDDSIPGNCQSWGEGGSAWTDFGPVWIDRMPEGNPQCVKMLDKIWCMSHDIMLVDVFCEGFLYTEVNSLAKSARR